jgi:NADH-quinone oxidoreductase subunit A
MQVAESYIAVLSFIATGVLFVSVTFAISRFLRPNLPDPEKLSVYECGEEATTGGQVQFNSRFFLIALIFVLFEVEIVFLFPWATVFADKKLNAATSGSWGKIALVEMVVFVCILGLGLAYAWVKGHLDWVKPETKPTEIDSSVPLEEYELVNRKYA